MKHADLVPPSKLILDNGIGSNADRADLEKVRQEFAEVGEAIAAGLIPQGSLTAASHILDVGCGLGRVARGFVDFLDKDGSYAGIDIVPSSIEFCNRAYSKHSNFSFVHADVFSKFYNPQGTHKPDNYKFPFPDNSFDFVFSMSLFTHLMLDAAENYLREISRVAKPGSRIINTFFILDDKSKPLTDNRHDVPGGRVWDPEAPEAVSAIDLEPLKTAHEKCGLNIEGIGFGFWSGRSDGDRSSYQDCISARKRT